jgi:hypothetical protein
MSGHVSEVRRAAQWSLRALAVFFAWAACALAFPARADDSVPIALHLTPGHYATSEKLVHLVIFDMSKTLKSMAGGRADDETILEERAVEMAVKDGNAVSETETNTRKYGGDKPKSSDVKVRTVQYDGTIAPDGIRTPPRDVLADAGDGALDQLPDIPLAPGQTWTFSRHIRTDRELGEGNMTYLDKVDRIEDRNGHRIAIISVTGTGLIAPVKDMQDHGFRASTMDLSGTAEFDTTTGLPGVQHYVGKVRWSTTVMFAHIGVIFNDTYDAAPLAVKPQG